ncbi:uncharacterized protein in vnfD 5'region-like [Planococcus citri]|uniref:uncharacterized protein in vnfD 5'region-like n=1 Tax=Planococcus citri TaxID=170843 RepID=UPI0031F93973
MTLPLPEAHHDWATIRNPNRSCIYIDKTQYLWRMLVKKKARRRLITRPRYFGKSLFLQMTEQFFKGKQDLFKGLFVEKYGNKNIFPDEPGSDTDDGLWREYPVIYLKFRQSQKFITIDEFMSSYYAMIATIAQEYELQNFKPGYGCTRRLINCLYNKFNKTPVIVLVDDYDFPFERVLSQDNTKLANEIRDFFDDIFSTIESKVKEVGFLFIMGISKLWLGYGANNIVDETYNPEYSEAFGFTEEEITYHLGHYIEEFAESESLNPKNITDTLKHWYGGYQFDLNNSSSRIFNPVSALSSIRNKNFEGYRIKTSFMDPFSKMFFREGWSLYSLLKGVRISPSLIEDGLTEREQPTLIRWMFQNGYFTVHERQSSDIRLKIPNLEIETAINKSLYRRQILQCNHDKGILFK